MHGHTQLAAREAGKYDFELGSEVKVTLLLEGRRKEWIMRKMSNFFTLPNPEPYIHVLKAQRSSKASRRRDKAIWVSD